MAYSDGDVREAVEERGAELVAKVPPVTNGGRFPKTDFRIDLPGQGDLPGREDHHRRPAGQRSQGPPGGHVRLRPRRRVPPARCATQCTTSKGGRRSWSGPTMTVSRRPGPPRPNPRPRPCCVAGRKSNENRPSPRPRYAQSPLPGPTKNPAASPACSDRRQCRRLITNGRRKILHRLAEPPSRSSTYSGPNPSHLNPVPSSFHAMTSRGQSTVTGRSSDPRPAATSGVLGPSPLPFPHDAPAVTVSFRQVQDVLLWPALILVRCRFPGEGEQSLGGLTS